MNRNQDRDDVGRRLALVLIALAGAALLLSTPGGVVRFGGRIGEVVPDYGRIAILNVIQIEYRYE